MISGFLNSCKKHPGNTALIINDTAYTYQQLLSIAEGISEQLYSSPKKENKTLAGIYTDNSVYTYASIIAVLLSGSGFVPLNNKFPAEKLKSIVSSSGLKHILCPGDKLVSVRGIINIPGSEINFIQSDAVLPEHPQTITHEPADPEATAYLLYTSGSTGVPKGIGITNKNFRAFLKAMNTGNQYDFRPDDKFLQIFELSFDVSIACTFLAWEAGACLVPVSREQIVFIEALECIKKHEITVVSMAPSAVSYMKQLRLLEHFDFPFVRYSFLTGEALPHKLAEAWQEVATNSAIINAYGPTEVTVWSFMYEWTKETSEKESLNGLVPIGKALPGLEYEIVTSQEKTVDEEITGELIMWGEQVAAGYRSDPARSKASFYKTPSGEMGYRTGDLVVQNKNGNLVYINRIDNQVQINGYRVEPGEIEFRIREFTNIENTVVLPVTENENLYLVAVVENIGSQLEPLKEYLRNTLQPYMIPRTIFDIGEMPLNNSGKIDRQKLKHLFA